jgi:hypothetical protein
MSHLKRFKKCNNLGATARDRNEAHDEIRRRINFLSTQFCLLSERRCNYNFSMKMAVFWVVATCRMVWVYQHFRGLYCLHHHGQSTQRYNSQDGHLHSHHRENLKSHNFSSCFCMLVKIISYSEWQTQTRNTWGNMYSGKYVDLRMMIWWCLWHYMMRNFMFYTTHWVLLWLWHLRAHIEFGMFTQQRK